jgi:O-antigen/teichoic acid export membrane protein
VRPSGVGSALRKLVGASAVYGLGSVLVRGLAFALLPLYTRYLSPAEYGIVALTVTCTVVLGLLYPLGLRGAVSRTYYESGTVEERKERVGTLWSVMIVSAAGMALVLDRVGPSLAATILPEVPFDPYLRLAVWTAFLGVLGLTPLALMQAQERPVAYVLITIWSALTTTAVTVWLVVRGDGAAGYLRGALIGAALAAVPYVLLTIGQIRPVIRMSILVPALGYSLPLVPHVLAGWALEMSDRAILTRLIPLHDVGVYSLGYQLGAVMGLLTTAFNAAWVPFLFGTLKQEGEAAHPKLARLVTYYAIALCFIGLGWSLLVEHAITLIAGAEYREAYRITPWVVGGYVCAGLYLIPTNLLFWRQQTRVFPLVTLTAGVANIGLNLWLVPRYGAIAAAWSTLAAYAILLILTWRSAERLHPFPYEYRRLGLMAGLALALFLAGQLLPFPSPALEVAGRALLWLAFPLGLLSLGMLDRSELAVLTRLIRGRSRPPAQQSGPIP